MPEPGISVSACVYLMAKEIQSVWVRLPGKGQVVNVLDFAGQEAKSRILLTYLQSKCPARFGPAGCGLASPKLKD